MFRIPLTGVLAWLVPGLGHLYVGQRARGWVCLVTITATFWAGVAIGGVQGTIDPRGERELWFVAQICAGGNALAGYMWHVLAPPPPPTRPGVIGATGPILSTEVGIHYTGVAGLLNLLVIFDAIARADSVSTPNGRKRSKNQQPQDLLARGGP